jgi:hypothetical protein
VDALNSLVRAHQVHSDLPMQLEVLYLLGNLKHKVEILVRLAKGQLDDLVLNLVVVKVLYDMKQILLSASATPSFTLDDGTPRGRQSSLLLASYLHLLPTYMPHFCDRHMQISSGSKSITLPVISVKLDAKRPEGRDKRNASDKPYLD